MDNDKKSKVSCTLSSDFVMVMVRTTLLMLSLRHFQIGTQSAQEHCPSTSSGPVPPPFKTSVHVRLQHQLEPKNVENRAKSMYFVFIWSASLPHFVNRSQFYFTLRGVSSLNSGLLDCHERVDFFGNRLEF
jgi:hypothetical protein